MVLKQAAHDDKRVQVQFGVGMLASRNPSIQGTRSLTATCLRVQVQFVLEWRYVCQDAYGNQNYATCPSENTLAPCRNYDNFPTCPRWGASEVWRDRQERKKEATCSSDRKRVRTSALAWHLCTPASALKARAREHLGSGLV